jgi:hypothetical protein
MERKKRSQAEDEPELEHAADASDVEPERQELKAAFEFKFDVRQCGRWMATFKRAPENAIMVLSVFPSGEITSKIEGETLMSKVDATEWNTYSPEYKVACDGAATWNEKDPNRCRDTCQPVAEAPNVRPLVCPLVTRVRRWRACNAPVRATVHVRVRSCRQTWGPFPSRLLSAQSSFPEEAGPQRRKRGALQRNLNCPQVPTKSSYDSA